MNYIVLDLEWDSAYFVPQKRFVNQILQIGAVKLDKDFNIVDTFEETVRSGISRRVSTRFAELTGITSNIMRKGIPLGEAVNRYNSWIGEDTVIMTWSNSDLYTVLENEKYLLGGLRFKIEKYLDLQSFIQNEMRILGFEIKSQISLAAAAEALGIKTEGLYMHTAKDDSIVCAELLKKYYNEERFNRLIKDTSKNNFFERLAYRPVYITDLEDECIDKKELEIYCDNCGQKATQKSNWKRTNRCFVAGFYCEKCHKNFCCRISFRKNYDGVTVKKKNFIPKKHINPKEDATKNDMQPVSEKV